MTNIILALIVAAFGALMLALGWVSIPMMIDEARADAANTRAKAKAKAAKLKAAA